MRRKHIIIQVQFWVKKIVCCSLLFVGCDLFWLRSSTHGQSGQRGLLQESNDPDIKKKKKNNQTSVL